MVFKNRRNLLALTFIVGALTFSISGCSTGPGCDVNIPSGPVLRLSAKAWFQANPESPLSACFDSKGYDVNARSAASSRGILTLQGSASRGTRKQSYVLPLGWGLQPLDWYCDSTPRVGPRRERPGRHRRYSSPMSSFQRSGLAAMKSVITAMRSGSCKTSTLTPFSRSQSSPP